MVKFGASNLQTMVVLTIIQCGIGLVVAFGVPIPQGQVWFWLIGSGVFHASYKIFLATAYKFGDLSRVYPIARGAAPLIVLIVGLLVLGDAVAINETVGIVVLGLGILMMGRGAFTSGESRRLVPFAFASAAATAGYTIVDGLGARVAGDPVMYVAWLFIIDAVIFLPACLAVKGREIVPTTGHSWLIGSVAAALSYVAYAIVVWAMTIAPIALVAAMRETSILFAIFIGWVVFSERMNAAKLMSAALIVLGVVVTRL